MRENAPIVMKFGGTSLAAAADRDRAAEAISAATAAGNRVIVVVSAMGRLGAPYATDTLIGLTASADVDMDGQAKDLVLSCGELISASVFAGHLRKLGVEARPLSGPRAGIFVVGGFGRGRIERIDVSPISKLLEKGVVPVVAGFQGGNVDGDVCTLLRGGSDVTACALGVAFEAQRVEIFTDVPGVMTADPRVVPAAQLLDAATYREVSALAGNGAKVIHPDAVSISEEHGLEIAVRSTNGDSPGTRIRSLGSPRRVSGIATFPPCSQFELKPEAHGSGAPDYDVFDWLGARGISVHFIEARPGEISFLVERTFKADVTHLLDEHGMHYTVDDDFARIAIIGSGMTGQPGLMALVMSVLQDAGIVVHRATDSRTSISCLVRNDCVERATNVLHEAFGL